jgi:hypothetical protein
MPGVYWYDVEAGAPSIAFRTRLSRAPRIFRLRLLV